MITVDEKTRRFHLQGRDCSYLFHVDSTGELINDHFGCPIDSVPLAKKRVVHGWNGAQVKGRKEWPDLGRGDFGNPAIHIRHATGHTVSAFKYVDYAIEEGKKVLPGLPATYGDEKAAKTLLVNMVDESSGITAILSYAIFPEYDSITRSVTITNSSERKVILEHAASLSVDLPRNDWEMVQLCGDWAREARETRRKVEFGTQGFRSNAGFSSHMFKPFIAMVHSQTTETAGQAIAFHLVYSGSHEFQVEQVPWGDVRVSAGLNPLQFAWDISPGESFTTPECIATFSSAGLGGMSRLTHRLFRDHLIRSPLVRQPRPPLLNNWEGTYFDFDSEVLLKIAQASAPLGVRLFVMDDGWFGNKYPRTSDTAGLGDWTPNAKRFPDGLDSFVRRVTAEGLQFGIWVEPEMVNPRSELYEQHPDWVLHAGDHERTLQRNQLVLNLGLVEVQEYIIDAITRLLSSAPISYVKWDLNRGMHETPSPSSSHWYTLGIYRVIDTLTTRFPHVMWEGCASGGGRFDPGLLHYWPWHWTSDDTDGLERLSIQFGTCLAYPASTMGCHVSAVPNHQVYRTTPLSFRAHVAMMGGSFGLELDPTRLGTTERQEITELIKLSDRVQPLVLQGEMYRLATPLQSNWPAVQYSLGKETVVLAFQKSGTIGMTTPLLPLARGSLDLSASYNVEIDGESSVYSGSTLVHRGLALEWEGDYDSKVVWVTQV